MITSKKSTTNRFRQFIALLTDRALSSNRAEDDRVAGPDRAQLRLQHRVLPGSGWSC